MAPAALSADPTRERHVLLTDESAWSLRGVEPSPCEDALRLVGLPANGRPLVDAAGTLGGLVEPTGVAVDRWGRIYVVDGHDGTLRRFDPCCGAFETLACIGGEGDELRRVRQPRGIAVSPAGFLHLVDSGNRRLQVFSLRGLALTSVWGPLDATGRSVAPQRAPDPSAPAPRLPVTAFPAGTWLPWGIAIGLHGRVHVSDYANGLVHCFDPGGSWRWARDGSGPSTPPLTHPTHLASDREGYLYVVQEGLSAVVVLDPDGLFFGLAQPPEHLRDRFHPGPVAADGEGNLFIADEVMRQLCRYRCPGPAGLPVRFSAGICSVEGHIGGLAFGPDGDPLVTLPAGRQVVRLEGTAAFALEGRAYSAALDSRLAECQWHRVVLSGTLPTGCSVRVDTFCSELDREPDEIETLPENGWATGQTWKEAGLREWDCTVLSQPGRYLWLRLTLTGTGAATPLLESIRVHFPRLSSIGFLPAVYRSTTGGGTFLERFLSIFDTLLGTIDGLLEDLPSHFDPRSTPSSPPPPSPSATSGDGNRLDFLTWLGSWMALTFDGTWSVARRRRLLRRAAELYALRGTPRGLREAVRVVAGIDLALQADLLVPGILEDFKLRRWLFLGKGRLGDQSTLWGRRIVDRLELGENSTIGSFQITDVGDPLRDPFHHVAHRFTVFVPAACCRDAGARQAVERIIQLYKPAHTLHRLELVEPRLRIGIQATIGFDTAIGSYPAGVIAGTATVGYDAVLQDSSVEPVQPRFRVGARSLIGSSVL